MSSETETLSAEEQSYFDTRGATEFKDIPAVDEHIEPVIEDSTAVEPVDAEIEPEDIDAETGEKATGQSKVPLASLTKTRQEAREERNKRIEAEKRAAVLEDRWNRVLEAQQSQQEAQQPQVDEIPDPNASPMEALAWVTKQITATKEAEAARAAETQQTQRAEQEWQQVYTAVNNDYTEAVAADASINDARDALIQSHGQELLAMGVPPERIQAEITRIENEHIRYAHSQGIPIGKYVKGLAQARGWTAKAAAPPVDPGEEIDRLSAAVEGSTSLSNAGGAAPRTLDAKAIGDMKPEEFEKWLAKDGNQAKFRKLAGG